MTSNRPKMFKKTLLASSIAAAVSVSSVTYGQEQRAEEEVVVKGIRASIQRSLDIKRDAVGVVDAISSQDIGKFPDTNLAESLQRITGVSIDRDRSGEGQEITVRGFGGGNNLILLNGRHMPSSQNPDDSSGSRAFDFSNIASDAVSGVEVYKTSRASIATGGVGATVNVKTSRPFDKLGLRGGVGVKAVHDTTNRTGDDYTPEISGLISWADDDRKFGVSLTASFQERHSGTGGGFITQWNTQPYDPNAFMVRNRDANGDFVDAAGVPVAVHPAGHEKAGEPVEPNDIARRNIAENAPDTGALWSRPSDFRYEVDNIERQRTNAQLVLQFSPVENITATLDYTYAENEIKSELSQQSIWFVDSQLSRVVFDDGPVATPVIWEEEYFYDQAIGNPDGGADYSFAKQIRDNVNENNSIGINIDAQITDSFNLTFDAHNSTAESSPRTHLGQRANVSTAFFGLTKQGVDWRSELPIMSVETGDAFGPATMTTTRGEVDWNNDETEITQFQLTGELEFDNGKLNFGVEHREIENETLFARIQPVFGDWGGLDPEVVPDEFFSFTNLVGELNDLDGAAQGPQRAIAWDFFRVVDWMEGEANSGAINQAASAAGTADDALPFRDFISANDLNPNNPDTTLRVQPDRVWHTNRTVKEETQSIFVQGMLNGEIAGMEANVVAGLRYESTDVTSTSLVPPVNAIVWESDNDFRIDQADPDNLTPLVREGSYDFLLPSIDFDIAFSQDWKGRVSYSKTIGRAAYDQLAAAIDSFDRDEQSITAQGGNPGLRPVESDNFDMSVEWYYGDASFASLGFFEKRVNNFIGESVVPLVIYEDIGDPFIGERRAQAEIDAGTSTDLAAIHTAINNGAPVVGSIENGDPAAEWQTTVPTNERAAKFYGFELGVQHLFGDTGFGIIANYTMVDSDTGYNIEEIGDQFALTGLSDTANFVGFYDNYGFEARLAINWRDEFLDTTAAKGGNEPGVTESFTQLDLNVSYDITPELEIFFEGLNLTEKNRREFLRTRSQFLGSSQFGTRYQVGARFTF